MNKLFDNLEEFKSKIALVDTNGKEFSYKEILAKINYINSKIQQKSLILIIVSNSSESIIGYISFIRSNHISILLDKSFKLEYVKKIIKKYRPNYIFSPKKYLGEYDKNHKIISLENYNLIKTNYKKYKNINKKNLLLLSTSGTTQSPKLVRLSSLNLQNNTNNIIKYLKINSGHITITTMPMAYSYGLSIINTHIQSGSKIIVNDKSIFDKSFWDKLYKYKVTSLGGVPQFYEQLIKLKFEDMQLPYLKYLTQAGGELDKNSLKYFDKVCKNKKIKFIVMYGQTEAAPRMSYLQWNKFSVKLGSIGKALEGSKFKIVDENGRYIKKSNITGELVFFGKNVSLGYASNLRDLSKGDINKGKLFTGDLAYKDHDNYVYIVGRKNRISKIFGLRINLDDIEKYLKKNDYKVKCISDNKYLKLAILNNYDTENIKKIIHNFYGINKNFIIISKVKKFSNTNLFKETITTA